MSTPQPKRTIRLLNHNSLRDLLSRLKEAPEDEKPLIVPTTRLQDTSLRFEQFQRRDGRFGFAEKTRSGERIHICSAVQIGGTVYVPLVDAITSDASMLLFPPSPHPDPQDSDRLFQDLLDFHRAYVTVPKHFDVLDAAYARATWRCRSFRWFPYLQAICTQERGKSRLLDVLQQTTYHGAMVSNMPAAIIYRAIALYALTLLVDEISGTTDKEVGSALRLGTKWNGAIWKNIFNPVTKDYEPRAYSCYGPKVLVGQEALSDDKLSSRSFKQNMSKVERAAGVPDDIEPSSPFYDQGRVLRARLLRDGIDATWAPTCDRPAEIKNDRQWQDLKPLWSVTPDKHRDDLLAIHHLQRRAIQNDRQESLQGIVLSALIKMGRPTLALPAEISNQVNSLRSVPMIGDTAEWDTRNALYVGPEKVGKILVGLGFDETKKDADGRRYRRFPPKEFARIEKDYFPSPSSDEVKEEES